MTTLTPILYADGALRLTDHGPRGGGLVLVHVDSGRQIDISAEDRVDVERILGGRYTDKTDVDAVFQHIDHWRSRSARDAWLRAAAR